MSIIVSDLDDLRRIVEEIGNRAMELEHPSFVFDLETRPGPTVLDKVDWSDKDDVKFHSTNPRTNEMYWISLATTGMACAVPMGHPNGEQIGWQPAPLRPGTKSTKRVVPLFAPPPEQPTPAEVAEIVRPLFFNSDLRKENHNVKFDLLTIGKYYGLLPLPPYTDTMMMHHLLHEEPPHDLGACVRMAFKYKYDKLGATLLTESFSRAGTYSYLDSKYTWLLKKHYWPLIIAEGLEEYFWFDCDITEVTANMEWDGIPVIGDEVGDLDVFLRGEMDRMKGELWSEAGREFDLNSPSDQAGFIFGHCGHNPRIFTPKKKEPSLKADHLRLFTADKRVKLLMDYHDDSKLHSTYVLNYQKFVHNDRIHTSFKQHGTVTGRFSSGEPNLQNVPRPDTEVGKRIRGLFWGGSDDMVLVVGDYSQIELRVLAHFSGDPTMCKAFDDGEDIHQASADTLGTERSIAKNINFAIPFGAGPSKIAAMGGGAFSEKTAKKFYGVHKERFPDVWGFIDDTKRECYRDPNHTVYTLLGRKRRLPQIRFIRHHSEELRQLGARAGRQAVNTVIQGSAADMIKKAMVRLYDTLDDDMQLVLQIHDELVVITPRAKADRCIALMREAMEGDEMQILRVPVTANIAAVDRWSEAKE